MGIAIGYYPELIEWRHIGPDSARAKVGAKVNVPANERTHVILVVEDEFLVRLDAVHMIRNAGFQAVEAANADEAISILESRCDIAVVFTDVQMPGSMDGLKLAAAVRGRWPPIKIIATSGNVRIGSDLLPKGGRFLPKPYTKAQILTAIAEAA